MRVLMLGWEFPPYISGGLGTACLGLTRALSEIDTQITFLLPQALDAQTQAPDHLQIMGAAAKPNGNIAREAAQAAAPPPVVAPALDNVTFHGVPAAFHSPYAYPKATRYVSPPTPTSQPGAPTHQQPIGFLRQSLPHTLSELGEAIGCDYDGDLVAETQRYAALCIDKIRGGQFDVIHAHDWLTFPAGIAAAALTGRPMVAHIHSTEFDRAGENIHQAIYDIERRGVHAAARVIAVSRMTKKTLVERYGVHPDKIDVIYNGVEPHDAPARHTAALTRSAKQAARRAIQDVLEHASEHTLDIDHDTPASLAQPAGDPPRLEPRDKVVLFLGRITMQKGPEYFVAAAQQVLGKMDHVKFVMAGAGDMAIETIEHAARSGIGHKILFTGFLSREEVSRAFDMADVYVMPSVSEPFGIAPLEAVSHDVPVIISKTSGVSEVLHHALKVDFWDTQDIANKIIAVLRHAPLANTLREEAETEIGRLTWPAAAERCLTTYAAAQDVASPDA